MISSRHITQELERRILYGLSCEWSMSAREINYLHGIRFPKPLFTLKDMKNRIGYWSPPKNEICLSRDFVLNHPWDSIREVLLHEMAHQLAYFEYDGNRETPHGPAFHKACDILKANPRASGSYRTLHERLKSETSEENDRIMLRVKKLLALAESRNKNEAEAAMVKAHELIAKYHVEHFHDEMQKNFFSIFLGKPALRHFREAYHMAHLLQEFYFVRGIWIPAYVIEKEKMGRVLEISGEVRHVETAGYVYDFVNHFIDGKWRDYNQKRKLNRYRKTDFAVGVIEGFRSKLESEQERIIEKNADYALVKVEDPQLENYIRYRFPRLVGFRRGGGSRDEQVIRDGHKIGKKLVISKGIDNTGESGKYLE